MNYYKMKFRYPKLFCFCNCYAFCVYINVLKSWNHQWLHGVESIFWAYSQTIVTPAGACVAVWQAGSVPAAAAAAITAITASIHAHQHRHHPQHLPIITGILTIPLPPSCMWIMVITWVWCFSSHIASNWVSIDDALAPCSPLNVTLDATSQ